LPFFSFLPLPFFGPMLAALAVAQPPEAVWLKALVPFRETGVS